MTASTDFQLPLKVINFWGGPGSGKSTTACGLFNIMKNLGLSVELVSEFAKDLTYQRDLEALGNQLFILGEQDARLRRLVGRVEWAITDSPLPLGLAYCSPEYSEWLPDAMWGAYERYHNHDFLLRRAKRYEMIGRFQTESEALALDITLSDLFREATTHEVGGEEPEDAWEIKGDAVAPHVAAMLLGVLK